MSDTSTETVPALFEHCCNVYRAMLGESHAVVQFEEEVPGGLKSSIIVYEGFLTQLITGKLNLSVPYYTSVRKALLQMGCIRQLRRGGSTTPSQWEMIYEPTVEAFLAQRETKQPKQTKESQLQDQVISLTNRINELEDWQHEINIMLINKFGAEE